MIRKFTRIRFWLSVVLLHSTAVLYSCSVDSAKNHYVLAEKLWVDRKYSAAVSEFEKVTVKDPKGKLGLQALYRGATTQFLFLNQHGEAVRKFRTFAQFSSDIGAVWAAQLNIGEILFSKTEQYNQAILHYSSLLRERPLAKEAPEFMFRIAKSNFFLMRFQDAVQDYQSLIKRYPQSTLAQRAEFEIGLTYFTQGEFASPGQDDKGFEPYEEAMEAYQKFILAHPKSEWVQEAEFGIASCLEELGQLEEAIAAFQRLQGRYLSPQVVAIKLKRIQERLIQRGK